MHKGQQCDLGMVRCVEITLQHALSVISESLRNNCSQARQAMRTNKCKTSTVEKNKILYPAKSSMQLEEEES